jgi:IMP dehydrogenase
LEDLIEKLKAGISSGISYSGGFNIPELQKNAKFVAISTAGMRESGSHDLYQI